MRLLLRSKLLSTVLLAFVLALVLYSTINGHGVVNVNTPGIETIERAGTTHHASSDLQSEATVLRESLGSGVTEVAAKPVPAKPAYRGALFAGYDSPRQFLEAYWGGRWPEVAAELDKESAWPSVEAFDVHNIADWEEAKGELLAKILGVVDTTRDGLLANLCPMGLKCDAFPWSARAYNPDNKVLDAAARTAVSTLGATYNERIDAAIEVYLDNKKDAYNDQFRREPPATFCRHPILLPGFAAPPYPGNDSIEYKMASGAGWTVYVALRRSDYPLVDQLWQDAKQLCAERDTALKDLIRDL